MGDNQKGRKIIKIKHIFANGEERENIDGMEALIRFEIIEMVRKTIKQA